MSWQLAAVCDGEVVKGQALLRVLASSFTIGQPRRSILIYQPLKCETDPTYYHSPQLQVTSVPAFAWTCLHVCL
jgi:hypothetical protein